MIQVTLKEPLRASLGSQCPKCGGGTVVLVSSYRRAPNKEYSEAELAGPMSAAQTRYRCSEGAPGWRRISQTLETGPRPPSCRSRVWLLPVIQLVHC
jgi:hypothetical protein